MKALITGSGGLIGSACVRLLAAEGWDVLGIDNDMRQQFFGPAGATRPVINEHLRTLPRYRHSNLDIRDRQGIRELLAAERPEFIIHTAAQPSHDKAASIPYDDFDVNACGAMNLLVAARDFSKDAPFCFTSTNKVYGDGPNALPLVERPLRYDYADRDGVDESQSIDHCLHSVFGASKVAADVMCQEFGRYFQMPVGIFRGGCLTGPHHSAVELHGYLVYIILCALTGKEYTIYGYHGKQVRDQIHCDDVARLFLEFYRPPRCGEVYNLGGGRANSISILETIARLAKWAIPCAPAIVPRTAPATTSATSPISPSCARISPAGASSTRSTISSEKSSPPGPSRASPAPPDDLQRAATRARIHICFPIGFNGSARYRRISAAETGSRDLTVSGKNRGWQSITS